MQKDTLLRPICVLFPDASLLSTELGHARRRIGNRCAGQIVLFAVVALARTFAVFAYWLFPVNSLAAPEWDVTVVDEHGKPVEGMTVRETWQNYSVEAHGKATRE